MNAQPLSGSYMWFGLALAASKPKHRRELSRDEMERLERELALIDAESVRSDVRKSADALDECELQVREEATTRYVEEASRNAPDTSLAGLQLRAGLQPFGRLDQRRAHGHSDRARQCRRQEGAELQREVQRPGGADVSLEDW